nr:GNAT family N-acetyltransferase [uncultured Stomatobaculum sp.]
MRTYREFGAECLAEVQEIYAACGWTSYLGDEEKLRRALGRSLFLLGAFEDGALVGFVRCVGDGEYILYVQDLIVTPALQRKGIGRELMRRSSERFSHVRQFLLITDAADAVSNAFYSAIGLKTTLGGYPCTAYYRDLPEL